MHAIDVRCRRENETSNSQDRHFVRPTIHSQFIYRRRVRCRPKRKHTNDEAIVSAPLCTVGLGLFKHTAHALFIIRMDGRQRVILRTLFSL